jgi:hypothetical protein
LDQFIKKHGTKVGDRCLLNLGQAQALLEWHFTPEHSLKEITEEKAAKFREWLTAEGYAQATIAGHIKKSKQFFGEAVTIGAIKHNPFDGVAEPWPRLFHNLRGSLETDLFEKFPAHVVVAWLGNSERIALKHYLKVTDNHLAAASTFGVGQQVGTSTAETTESSGNEGEENIDFPEDIEYPPSI